MERIEDVMEYPADVEYGDEVLAEDYAKLSGKSPHCQEKPCML